MGCFSSKEKPDVGGPDQFTEEKPAIDGGMGRGSGMTMGVGNEQVRMSISPGQDPSKASFLLRTSTARPPSSLQGSKAAASSVISTPNLSSQVKSTAAVVLKQTANTAKGAHHLKNVFAAPLEDVSSFAAPSFPKDPSEKQFIREALRKNFVFAGLSEREMRTMIDAFEHCTVQPGETLIQQGDVGDYFYVIRDGTVRFEVSSNVVGHAGKGKSCGELALLYTSPRAASVIAETITTVYRVDQKTFRYIMQSQTLQAENDKKDLLQGISFLRDLDPTDLNKLVHTMTPRVFEPGEHIVRKGEDGDTFYVIQEGKVRVTNITIGSTDYEDQTLSPGEHFGERALVTKEPRTANCIGKTKGIALSIDKDTFEKVVGKLAMLTLKSEDKRKLSAIRLFQMTHLSPPTLAALASQFRDIRFPPKTVIVSEGKVTNAALYLVRRGKLEIKSSDGEHNNIIDAGGYFGEDMLELDIGGLKKKSECVCKYTAKTLSSDVVVGVLTIEECRKIIDTTSLGHGKKKAFASLGESKISLDVLDKHAILGAGTFGQVWLVSNLSASGTRRPYALKIQSKFELVENHQAKSVVQEKNLMQQLHHPFLINLVQTYQDAQHVYMLLGLVQGGELFSLLHQATYDGISERDAKFYASGVLEGLSHMHRRHILYRDLKPENVLIDSEGYPVIVDFGFAKYVTMKTYTLCGTPLYLAPEVLLNRGHDRGADHWSYAVLVYEMIAGYTPFYSEGMDQIALFQSICKGVYQFPPAGVMSMEVEDLLQRFFVLDPAKRLGSLARGINEIYAHTWFSDVDFAELRHKELNAPWVPEIKDPLDKSNFENWDHLEDKTLHKNPPLSAEQQRIFQNF